MMPANPLAQPQNAQHEHDQAIAELVVLWLGLQDKPQPKHAGRAPRNTNTRNRHAHA